MSVVDSDIPRIYLRLRAKFDPARLRSLTAYSKQTHKQTHRQLFSYVHKINMLQSLNRVNAVGKEQY